MKSAEIKKEEPVSDKNPVSIPPAIEITKRDVHPEKVIDQRPIKNRVEDTSVKELSSNQRVHELEEKQKQEQLAERERQTEQARQQRMAKAARAEQEAKRAASEALFNQRVRELQEKQKQEQMAQRERQAEQLRRQQVAESVRAAEEAEQAASEATDDLKELLRLSNSTSKGATGSQGNENKEKETDNGPVVQAYLASISSRIQQFWALPEFAKWDQSLKATVVITIDQNGRLQSHSFQEHSTNKLFDQYVEKTLEQATPLPPIPPALKKSQFEIGLVFKPTGLQNKR